MICPNCFNRGYTIDNRKAGVYSFNPCSCEIDGQALAERWRKLDERIHEAKRRLQTEAAEKDLLRL